VMIYEDIFFVRIVYVNASILRRNRV